MFAVTEEEDSSSHEQSTAVLFVTCAGWPGIQPVLLSVVMVGCWEALDCCGVCSEVLPGCSPVAGRNFHPQPLNCLKPAHNRGRGLSARIVSASVSVGILCSAWQAWSVLGVMSGCCISIAPVLAACQLVVLSLLELRHQR